MDLNSEPPFAPETTSKQRAAILAQIGIAVTNAAVRMNQISGQRDQAAFAHIAGDLFEEMVNILEVQVKTTSHVGLHGQIINWSRIQAKQLFTDPSSSQEVDVRSLGRHKRFLEDVAAHFSKPDTSVETGQNIAAGESKIVARPTLPLEIEAAIETARETFKIRARERWPMVFNTPIVGLSALMPVQPRPANLKLELGAYASGLFDLEAAYYGQLARDADELRTWLSDLSLNISSELVDELDQYASAYNFHCRYSARQTAIWDALGKRVEHWVTVGKSQYVPRIPGGKVEPMFGSTPIRKEEPSAAPVRSRSLRPPEAAAFLSADVAMKNVVELRSEARKAIVLPLLKKKGMTRSKLASDAGVDPSVVYDYLSGKSTPRPDNRNVLAEVLGILESELPE